MCDEITCRPLQGDDEQDVETCCECGEPVDDPREHARLTNHDVNGTAHQGGPGRPMLHRGV